MNDYKDRIKIVKDLDTNFIVSASAGSGKTSMLVQRMVALVEAGVNVQNIAAITFTKKAANEFYTRFYETLSNRSQGLTEKYSYLDEPTEITKARDKEALKNIDLCFLGTIDSFCNAVLSQYPLEAEIPVFSEVCEDVDYLKLEIRKELDKCTRGEYGNTLRELLLICSNFIKDDKIVDAVYDMFSGCQYDVNVLSYDDPVFKAHINEFVNDANELLKIAVNLMHDKTFFVQTKDPAKAYKNLSYYKKRINNNNLSLLQLLNCFNQFRDLGFEIPNLTVIQDVLVKSLSRVTKAKSDRLFLDKDSPLFQRYKEIKYVYIANFSKELFKIVEAKFRKEGILTFSTAPVYLNNLLKKDDKKEIDIITKVSNKYQRFLIDEYQDTSPLQNEIFFRITSEERNADWKKLHPKAGSLFVVGDPKQGIYHFRGADICSFLDVKKLFDDPSVGEQINLFCNYRSTKRMCEDFNSMFTVLMPETTPLQEKYPEIPLDEKKYADVSELEGTYSYESTNDPETVANLVEDLVNSGKTIGGKKITYDSFMIIPSSKTHLNEYLKEFTKRKIPAFEEGKVEYNLSLIKGIYHLIKYIVYRDSLSKLELQCSGIFNSNPITDDLSYNPLEVLFTEDELKDLSQTFKISTLIEKILGFKKVIGKLPSDGLELVLSIVYLLKEKEENADIKTPIEALNLIGNLVKDSDVERIAPLSTSLPSVKIANLHKVKGLEAPIVILAKSGKNTRLSNSIDPVNNKISFMKIGDVDAPKVLYEKEINYETEYSESEYLRLLYVAATRARQVLFINANDKSKYWEPLFKFATDYGEIPNKVESENTLIDLDDAFDSSKNILKEKDIRPTHTYELDVPSDEKSFSTRMDDEEHVYLKGEDAPLIGTLVHKLMETIVNHKDEIIDFKSAIELFTRDLIDKPYIKEILINVAKTIYGGGYNQKNGAPKDVLEFAKSGDTYTEVPFSYLEDGHVVSGYIDLIVYLKDEIVIIDYKTDSNVNKKHDGQLAYYVKALSMQEDKKVSSFIYNIII